MTRSRPITFLASAAVIPLAALAVAACGGGGAATASPPPAPSKTTTRPPRLRPSGLRIAAWDRILVDSTGRTLYLFKADSATNSACSGACAVAWPPLLANGTPAAGAGLTASKVGTITRSGGSRQVTYNGHPLYLFIKDTKPGDLNRPGPDRVRRRLVRGFSCRQPDLKPRHGPRQRLIVFASGRTRRPARCEAPTGSEARAPACSEVRTEAGAARCEAGSASQQRHSPKQRW